MKQLLIKTTVLISLSLLSISCDDFLEVDNPNAPAVNEVFQTLDDTESSLNAVYNTLYNHALLSIEEEALSSDVATPGNKSPEGTIRESIAIFYEQSFNTNTTAVNRKWAALYRGIFFANQTIVALKSIESSIPDSGPDRERYINQMAQARFFRGVYHFYLHERYNNGNVIIIGDEDFTENINEINSRPISTSEEVIAFFREDLLHAYDNLPLPSEIEDSNIGRVSKGTAATILANSYLYEEEFDLAIPLYEEVINDFNYELVRDLDLLFTTAGEFNSESIFEIAYTIEFGTEQNAFDEESLSNRLAQSTSFFGTGGDANIGPASWLIDAYSAEKLNPLDPRNMVTNGEDFQDLRRVSMRASAMVALIQDLDTPYYLFPNTLQTSREGRFTVLGGPDRSIIPSLFKHFTNHDVVNNENNLSSGSSNKSGKNVTINRLAEVYINLAEAYLRGSQQNLPRALELINTLRDRWGVQKLGPDTAGLGEFDGMTYDVASLFKHIQEKEKPLELSIEGYAIRNIDLRRWGIKADRFRELASQEIQAARARENSIGLSRGSIITAGNTRIVIDGLIEGEDPQSFFNLPEPLNPSGGNSGGGQRTSPPFSEFGTAARNYNDQDHAYWPLPAEEILENTTL